MITRYNFKWTKPKKKSSPIKVEYEYIEVIEPVTYNEDKKTVKEYKVNCSYVKHESKWHDFIQSFNLGSISEQVMNHITKGTPLVTGHTLPPGNYTSENLLKGAEIVRQMREQGITLDMLNEAFVNSQAKVETSTEGGTDNGEK